MSQAGMDGNLYIQSCSNTSGMAGYRPQDRAQDTELSTTNVNAESSLSSPLSIDDQGTCASFEPYNFAIHDTGLFPPSNAPMVSPAWIMPSGTLHTDYIPLPTTHQNLLLPGWQETSGLDSFAPLNSVPSLAESCETVDTASSLPIVTYDLGQTIVSPATSQYEAQSHEVDPEEAEAIVPRLPTRMRNNKSSKKVKASTLSAPYQSNSANVAARVALKRGTSIAFRACWRCKKYRKSCDNNTVCNSCVITSGFRVWPSSLGCRRGSLEDCVYLIIPVHSNEALEVMNYQYVKPFSWRYAPKIYEQSLVYNSDCISDDFYEKTIQSMHSTRIHGPGIIELLQIAARFQRKKKKEDIGLRLAFAAMYLVTQLYHTVVSPTEAEMFDDKNDLAKMIIDVRKAAIKYTDRFLHTCLTGRLKSWPSAFLAADIGVISFVLLADAIAAIPEGVRNKVWKNVGQIVIDLRRHLYEMAQELLFALAKGADMLKMTCWNFIKEEGHDPKPNNHGMQLMEQDRDAFDTMVELVQWRTEFFDLLNGDSWMSNTPFAIDLLIVMSLSRLFSVFGRPREILSSTAEITSTVVGA